MPLISARCLTALGASRLLLTDSFLASYNAAFLYQVASVALLSQLGSVGPLDQVVEGTDHSPIFVLVRSERKTCVSMGAWTVVHNDPPLRTISKVCGAVHSFAFGVRLDAAMAGTV